MGVLPMGFSWAFHLAHSAHEYLASVALPEAPLIRDRRAVPDLLPSRPCLLIYADNADHLGLSATQATSSRKTLSKIVNSYGLQTHDVVDGTRFGTSIGISFDGSLGVVKTSPERDAVLDQGLLAIIRGEPITGADLRKVVGHITIRCLLRRPLLSILHHCYRFIDKCLWKRLPVWDTVRRELWIIRSLLVFANSQLRSPFHPTAYVYDACLSGYGVVAGDIPVRELKVGLRHDERWRFKEASLSSSSHRDRALAAASAVAEGPWLDHPDLSEGLPCDLQLRDSELLDPLSVLTFSESRVTLEPDLDFPDIDHRVLRSDRWRPVVAVPLRFVEPVHLCEARALLCTVKYLSRN